MNNYEQVFSTTTTDVQFYDDLMNGKDKRTNGKPLKYRIVQMTPDEYLETCTNFNQCTLERVYEMIHEPSVQELIKLLETKKLPLPFFDYSINGQEGRHRAIVAKRLKLKTMPVLIIDFADCGKA